MGDEPDDATRGVGPEGAGLGTAEDLDLAQVEGAAERAEPGEVEVIDEKAHGRVGGLALELGVFADPANLQMARAAGAAGPSQIGDPVDVVAEMADAPVGERGGIEDGDARRDTIKGGGPEVGGDLEGFQRDCRSRGGGRGRRRGAGGGLGGQRRQGGERGAEEQDSCRELHL